MFNMICSVLRESWHLLLESSVYILFGLTISGLLRVFLSPNAVSRHLGKGRYKSVFKAAFLGIPIPLCSCGVLPAAVSLRKQGANRGATTAFLISTPESGVDSIAITYALMDPLMTIARPLVAFITAAVAGLSENALETEDRHRSIGPDLSCPIDACCDGQDCTPGDHRRHHTFSEKLLAGFRYALTEVWEDMAPWFLIGLILAGLITFMVPDAFIAQHLDGGVSSMLLMLVVGTPLYICATASTPIAAALILKGVSPGAALVFLLVGPATNITSLTVLFGTLGKRATAIYLTAIALSAVSFGMILDQIYVSLGLSARAMAGEAAEFIPAWIEWAGAILLLLMSLKPVYRSLKIHIGRLTALWLRSDMADDASMTRGPVDGTSCKSPTCGCSS